MFCNIFNEITKFLDSKEEVIRDGIIVIFLGLIITFGVKKFGLLLRYIYYFKKNDTKTGWRYFYHYSRDNKGKMFFCTQLIKIKRSFKNRYSVSIFEVDNLKEKRYKGSLDIEGANFILQLKSTFHSSENKDKETISIRVKKIYGDGDQDMPGLYLGVSFGSRIYSTTCLLTKTPNHTEESYNRRIKESLSICTKEYYLYEK